MIATIQQTRSNFQNQYAVICGNQALYYASAPWIGMAAPFRADNFQRLSFSDAQGRELYHTQYNIIDNALEAAVPLKFLATKEQRFFRFGVIGANGEEGAFYTLQNGLLDSKFCIEHRGRVLLGYDLKKGKINVVSVYDGDRQIAQITKPLAVRNNLDVYYLHLKDGYEDLLPVLAFFTIYFDYRKYNNSGQITNNSSKISVSYTYGKNNKKYNPGWIQEEFGPQAAGMLNAQINAQIKDTSSQFKRTAKIIALCAVVLTALITAFVIFLVGKIDFSRPSMTAEDFAQRTEEAGFTVNDITEQFDEGEMENAILAADPGDQYQLEFYVMPDEEEAERVFAGNRAYFEAEKGVSSYSGAVSMGNYRYYHQTSSGRFYLVSCIDNTLLYCIADQENADEIKEIVKELGYL